MKVWWRFVLLMLVCVFITACGAASQGASHETKESPRDQMLILSDEMKQEILDVRNEGGAYPTKWWEDGGQLRYYGTYGESIIIYRNLPATEHYYEIDGYKWNTEIRAYRDGVFYDLDKIYEFGDITLDDLKAIEEYHLWFKKYQDLFDGPPIVNEHVEYPEKLSSERNKEVRAWIEQAGYPKCYIYDYEFGRNKSGGLWYYDTYDDAVVLFWPNYESGETSIKVAGVTISYKDEFLILVCKDEKVYTLAEAYEEGLLKKKDIRRIADFHYSLDPNGNNWEEE